MNWALNSGSSKQGKAARASVASNCVVAMCLVQRKVYYNVKLFFSIHLFIHSAAAQIHEI